MRLCELNYAFSRLCRLDKEYQKIRSMNHEVYSTPAWSHTEFSPFRRSAILSFHLPGSRHYLIPSHKQLK